MKPFLEDMKNAAQFGLGAGIVLVFVVALPKVISTKTLVWDWNYALAFLGGLLGAVACSAFIFVVTTLVKKYRLR